MACVFGVVSKMTWLRSLRFTPFLSSKSFIILHFTCGSVICFQLIFCKVLVFFFFFFCMKMSNYFYTICWKYCLCSITLLVFLCQRLVDYIYGICFWTIYSIDLVYSFTNATVSLLSCYSKSWSQVGLVLQICSSSAILCWLDWVFCLSIFTSELFFDSNKITSLDFDLGCIKSIDQFGKN